MKKLFYILAIAIILLFSSCPATPPSITPSGLDPHRTPDIPENVQVVSGLKDRIIISWDAVENADSYRVFYVDAGNPSGKEMVLTPNAITNTRVSVDLTSNNSPELSSGTSYYFYVTAYRSLDGEQFVSSPSNYVEGAIAPHTDDIFYHGYITGTRINLYWNCSTLFSTDDPDEMLYGADFSLEYRAKGENKWNPIESSTEHGPGNPWLNEVLNLNRWPQDTTLEFQIKAAITAGDGTTSNVTSNAFEVLVSNDMTPSPVENVNFTQGDSIDGITLSWTIPEWTGGLEDAGANSYFKIERAESGTSGFETLVDEISTSTHDGKITRNPDKCTFVDNNVEVGKRYIYRIVNAAEKDGLIYIQSEQEYYVTGEAYLFDDPGITESKAAVKKENSASASITFTWNYVNKENLKWAIERTIMHPDSNDETSYIELQIDESTVNKASATFTETMTCTTCEDSAHKYSYRLCLVRDDDTDTLYWKSSEDFTLTENGAPITDNKLELKTEPIIENLQIIKRIGKIELRWNLKENIDSSSLDISYTYVLDGEETLISNGINNEGSTYSFIINISDVEKHNISLIAKAEGGYRNVLTGVGNALGFNSDLFIMATNSDDEENTINVIVDNLSIEYPEMEVFTIEYKETSASDWINSGITVSSENKNYKISNLDLSKDYVFRLALSDIAYTDDAPAYSKEVSYMKVTNVSATKGETGQIVVSWNAVENASEYEIYRYEAGEEVSAYDYVGSLSDTSYSDATAEPGVKYYYLVKAKNGEYATGYSINPSASVKNQFEKDEEGNLGYVYNSNAIAFTVEESFASDTKLNPYFAIKFKMDETNSVYKLTAVNDTEGITINLGALTTKEGSTWTNGLNNTEKGYVSLNTDTLEATVNADIGVIDDLTNYTISNFGLQAMRNTDSSDTTAVSSINEPHHKALGVYDYLYIVNTALSQELTIANSSDHFNCDWWLGNTIWGQSDVGTGVQHYYGTNVEIANSSGINQNSGSASFTGYKFSGISISGNISTYAVDDGSYIGKDPLSRIGNDSNNRTVSITVEKTNSIDGKTISYDNASISYNDVYVDGSAGTYTVTIGGTAYDPIAQTDAKLIKKVELNN